MEKLRHSRDGGGAAETGTLIESSVQSANEKIEPLANI
jgi:hypothetical protein